MKPLEQLKFSEFPLNVPDEKKIIKKVSQYIEEFKKADNGQKAYQIIKKYNKLFEKVSTDVGVISIRYSLETNNEVYKKAQDRCDEVLPLLSNYSTQFEKLILESPFRAELEKKLGSYLFAKYEADLKSFDEKIIPELIQENKLSSEYDSILGSAEIEFRGEILNLSQLGKYTQSADRETRKAAAKATDKWMGEHEQRIGEIYSELVTLRDQMAKKLGYKNFVELGYLRLGRTDYNAEMVANYRKQIAESVVPVAQKLYKQQAKSLGIRKPQYYDYNLHFKSGNPLPAGDQKYLVDAAHYMYSDMGKETKEFFEMMMDRELLDLDARKGKTTGGYMSYLSLYKAPFIFSNFNGTDADVNVLTHEGGHALQAYLSKNIKVPEYQSPTLESCEIHSMSMEFFAWKYADKFFGKDGEKYKFLHLSDAIEFLPYGISIDEFQHWVYENPTATHEQRCQKWKEIESRYTPHKRYDDTPTYGHGAFWIRQGHVFGSPFYYIDYTLAQVVAFQFLVEMNKNREKAFKKYIKLCKFGGQAPFVTLLEKNHLRNPFIDGNVAKVVKPLVRLLKGFDTSKF